MEAEQQEHSEGEDDVCDMFGAIEYLISKQGAIGGTVKEYLESTFESFRKRLDEKIGGIFTNCVEMQQELAGLKTVFGSLKERDHTKGNVNYVKGVDNNNRCDHPLQKFNICFNYVIVRNMAMGVMVNFIRRTLSTVFLNAD